MKRYLLAVFCLAVCLFESPAYSDTAGFKRGMSVEEVKAMGFGRMETYKAFPDTWFIARPNYLHGATVLGLYIPPKHGLLKFTVMWEAKSDPYGNKLRELFDISRSGMAEKYGKGVSVDYLKRGSTWKGPEHFMQSLVAQERVLEWGTKLRPNSGNDYLESVAVKANAYNASKGSVTIFHYFSGYHDYTKKQSR